MKKIVKFCDSELGDDLVEFSFSDEVNFDKIIEFCNRVLFQHYGADDYDWAKEDYPELTKEMFDKYCEIFDGGDNGVISERYCDFVNQAFGIEYKYVAADCVVEIY